MWLGPIVTHLLPGMPIRPHLTATCNPMSHHCGCKQHQVSTPSSPILTDAWLLPQRELRELTLRGPWFIRYLFGRPDMPDAAATPPQLPAGFQALHLDLELAEHERAVPHVSLASLEALAKLSLVSISAPTIRVALLTNDAAVAGPPRLRLACTRLDVALARAVDCEPLGDDQLRPSQLLHWLSRLLAGNAELSLSCEPWQNVVVRLLRARNTFEDFENWTLQYNSVADLAAALRPHASEHGLSVRLAAQDTELVLEREL